MGKAGPLRTILPDYDAIGLCARKAVRDRTIDAVGLCIHRAQLPPKCFNTLVDADVTGTLPASFRRLSASYTSALCAFSQGISAAWMSRITLSSITAALSMLK